MRHSPSPHDAPVIKKTIDSFLSPFLLSGNGTVICEIYCEIKFYIAIILLFSHRKKCDIIEVTAINAGKAEP